MNKPEKPSTPTPKALGKLLRARREELKLSSREVADGAGIADSTVIRMELGGIANPRPEVLRNVADVLGLDLADLYAAAGYAQAQGLPSFAPYLRSRYADLPAKAQQEIERSFKQIADKYGYDPAGPKPGEDEREDESEGD